MRLDDVRANMRDNFPKLRNDRTIETASLAYDVRVDSCRSSSADKSLASCISRKGGDGDRQAQSCTLLGGQPTGESNEVFGRSGYRRRLHHRENPHGGHCVHGRLSGSCSAVVCKVKSILEARFEAIKPAAAHHNREHVTTWAACTLRSKITLFAGGTPKRATTRCCAFEVTLDRCAG